MSAENRLVYVENYLPGTVEALGQMMVPALSEKTLTARLDKFATKISDGWYCSRDQFERIVRNRFGPKVLPAYRRR